MIKFCIITIEPCTCTCISVPESLLLKLDKMLNSHLLVHALAEVHFLSQTLAAVFQVHTKEHLISKVFLCLSKTCIQLTTNKQRNNRQGFKTCLNKKQNSVQFWVQTKKKKKKE